MPNVSEEQEETPTSSANNTKPEEVSAGSIESSNGLNITSPYVDFAEISLEKKIGRGTFGVVYKAVWRNRYVAVKKFERTNKKTSMEREIKQLSRVKHPNIIAFYGIAEDYLSKYLIMEYAEGGSLHQFLHDNDKAHYSMAHAMSWARQCAEAVAYLHAMKPKPLVHRDLKPLNLLLTDKGRFLKICDFGTVTDLVTLMTNGSGTAAWMAPEVFNSFKYTEKCDVFSWGIVLWEMLARENPFKDIDNAYCVMWTIHSGKRPPPIPELPEPIEELMTSCWAENPELRPSMQDVVEKMNMLMLAFPGADEPLNYELCNQEVISNNSESIGEEFTLDSSNYIVPQYGINLNVSAQEVSKNPLDLTDGNFVRNSDTPVSFLSDTEMPDFESDVDEDYEQTLPEIFDPTLQTELTVQENQETQVIYEDHNGSDEKLSRKLMEKERVLDLYNYLRSKHTMTEKPKSKEEVNQNAIVLTDSWVVIKYK